MTSVSNELIIQRSGNGIKLCPPIPSLSHSDCSVANILKLPLNICFMNTESILQDMSEACVEICGMISPASFRGKNALAFTPAKEAATLFANDRDVMRTNKIKILEERFTPNKDEQYLQFISVKAPWYDAHNKVVGIFNCAIALEKQPLEIGLATIAKLGLLDSAKPSLDSEIAKTYLSQREMQCLELYVRGKTAKMIAKILGLSPRTIEHYLENIKEKLGVTSKHELIDHTIDFFTHKSGRLSS